MKDWNFYMAFSFFRVAAILQGVYKRALEGQYEIFPEPIFPLSSPSPFHSPHSPNAATQANLQLYCTEQTIEGYVSDVT